MGRASAFTNATGQLTTNCKQHFIIPTAASTFQTRQNQTLVLSVMFCLYCYTIHIVVLESTSRSRNLSTHVNIERSESHCSVQASLMTFVNEKQSRSGRPHPYLHGNFAPIHR